MDVFFEECAAGGVFGDEVPGVVDAVGGVGVVLEAADAAAGVAGEGEDVCHGAGVGFGWAFGCDEQAAGVVAVGGSGHGGELAIGIGGWQGGMVGGVLVEGVGGGGDVVEGGGGVGDVG